MTTSRFVVSCVHADANGDASRCECRHRRCPVFRWCAMTGQHEDHSHVESVQATMSTSGDRVEGTVVAVDTAYWPGRDDVPLIGISVDSADGSAFGNLCLREAYELQAMLARAIETVEPLWEANPAAERRYAREL
ncbi:hypothetical protein AAFP35_10110 [Gordonia sp. CPCC 206044]|uniref:hypothetical protein n=1 Tax=Gordonia sp. CPCC 206044 TaxID=3140793 RepID=UPI003AF3DC25